MKQLSIVKTLIFILIVSQCIVSCIETKENHSIDEVFNDVKQPIASSVKYADGFDIYSSDAISKLVIYNPKNTSEVYATYYIVDSISFDNFRGPNVVHSSTLDSVAVFSATQLNAFSKLELLDKVVAISESEYIQNPEVKELCNNNKIVNLASNGNFYLEKTLSVNPKIIFYSPYNMAQSHPLAATEITMIPFFDFMETNPLGRAEWIKFTALFFNEVKTANLIFDSIEGKYLGYKELTIDIDKKPTVFSDKYYSGQWFVPGGRSYIAQLFNDSGAEYIWKDNQMTASVNLDLEVVYDKAQKAKYWRIVGTYPNGFTYDELSKENDFYQYFDAFKNHNVIYCDSKTSTYFETGTLEPHVLLADLIHVFHPKLLPNYNPKYYHLCK